MAPSSFVDDSVFAYWDREVISTSLVSLLGSGPDNHTGISALFPLVLTVLQIISFAVPPRVHSHSVYCSRKARLIGCHTHTLREGFCDAAAAGLTLDPRLCVFPHPKLS